MSEQPNGQLEALREQVERRHLEHELELIEAEAKMVEALIAFPDNYVDPREAYLDQDGNPWPVIGKIGAQATDTKQLIFSEDQLREIRGIAFYIAATNEFAIGAIENLISYVVGEGHKYRVAPRERFADDVDESVLMQANDVVSRFLEEQCWPEKQEEIVRRGHRDGEVFLRFFEGDPEQGYVQIRFIEPDQVHSPSRSLESGTDNSYGVATTKDDVATVMGYYVDGTFVDATEIQHRKLNVDSNCKRGLSSLYPVTKNLHRTEQLQENVTALAKIQAAIALIRKHKGGTKSAVKSFVNAQSDTQVDDPRYAQRRNFKRYNPATILDSPDSIDYEFPSMSVDPARFIEVIQAELRAIAARFVMPEYMLSQDASNANYSSTLVAEGPAVKRFKRLQRRQIEADCKVIFRVLRRAEQLGQLPEGAAARLVVEAEPPTVQTRNQLEETQVRQLQHQSNILSRHTWQLQAGLDPHQEDQQIENDPLTGQGEVPMPGDSAERGDESLPDVDAILPGAGEV